MPDVPPASAHGFRDIALHRLLQLRQIRRDAELVIVEMPVDVPAFNSSGNLHGGAIATLIDVACGMAVARGTSFDETRHTIVTADLHVRYLGRPRGDCVRAEARVLRAGRQLIVVECLVRDREDRLIAAADFSSMLLPIERPAGAHLTAAAADYP